MTISSAQQPRQQYGLGSFVKKITKREDDLNEINKHRDGSLYNYITDPWGNTVELIYYPEEKN